MSTRLPILQICCVFSVALGAAAVADFYGVGLITLGALGLLTPWVNAVVFRRERKSSDGGIP
jgi:hypothetical protein